jgi:hypothetical protein
MSKRSVWNKGKHNGGTGGPLGGKANKTPAPVKSDVYSEEVNNRIDRVERMNRENWVTRPARVKRDEQEIMKLENLDETEH